MAFRLLFVSIFLTLHLDFQGLMEQPKKITTALISVYYKDKLDSLIQKLHANGVQFYSTGGTQDFIESLGIKVNAVENLTGYPSILGGRVKTLHPKIFGGILGRRDYEPDLDQMQKYEIPEIDLVIVDLYPFEETVKSGASESDIIEKVDIGGISLIRAAAKNFKDVTIVASKDEYKTLEDLLDAQGGATTLANRKSFAAKAFNISSHYDSAIFNYFNRTEAMDVLKVSEQHVTPLRYGENPHQKGLFYGNIEELFDKLHGKELSYNNLLDVDAAVGVMSEFKNGLPTFAILKHNNACGLATRNNLKDAYLDALAADPTSAFGGVLIANKTMDLATAEEVNKLFVEVVIAPGFDTAALELLKSKKNRVILVIKETEVAPIQVRTALNGYLVQDKDLKTETTTELTPVTNRKPTAQEIEDLLFANKLVKHTKSNTIVLAKNGQLLASGTGQTSRVDALRQAIQKAQSFGFDLKGAAMASDAFFPFPDCVEIAYNVGIEAVIQPGGSVKDQDSIDYCNQNNMAMVTTGIRHFKH